MNYLFIILGIVAVIFLYFVYSFLFPSKSKVATKNYLANRVKDVSFEKLENPSSTKYSLEVWIYANSLNSGDVANTATDNGGLTNNRDGCIFEVPGVFHLDLFKDTSLAFNNSSSANSPVIKVPNFPLQRWVYVVISVDNALVDLYLDGKLIRSVKTRSTNYPKSDSFFKFGQGDIYIAGLNRTATTTDSNTVFKNYMQGNAGLKLPGYSISLDFLKNSTVSHNIPIM
jgi:hypothetical protein